VSIDQFFLWAQTGFAFHSLWEKPCIICQDETNSVDRGQYNIHIQMSISFPESKASQDDSRLVSARIG